MDRRMAAAIAMAVGICSGMAAAVMAPPEPVAPVLARLAGGRWQVHEIGAKGAAHDLCVTAPVQLVQLRHGHQACARDTISATATSATVHYSCAGTGYGQTVLTVEAPARVRIQTQGIADGQPFDLDLEARRIGGC